MSFISDYFKNIREHKKNSGAGGPAETWTGIVTKRTAIETCPFVVFDTELSGLDPRKDFIVSIGALKMTGGTVHISSQLYRLIRPAGEMTRKSVEIHGITPEELKEEESLDAVLPDFLEFIRDAVLVGHFINIDLAFMNRALKHCRR
jgi:DNA polymerase-3 subunit epsilon